MTDITSIISTSLPTNGKGLKLRGSPLVNRGLSTTPLHPLVDSALTELEAALHRGFRYDEAGDVRKKKDAHNQLNDEDLKDILTRSIWTHENKGEYFPGGTTGMHASPTEGGDTIRNAIERNKKSAILLQVNKTLSENLPSFPYNVQKLLDRRNVREYLFARAVFVEHLDADGAAEYLTDSERGQQLLYDYVLRRAVYLCREQRKLSFANSVADAIAQALVDGSVALDKPTFDRKLNQILEAKVFSKATDALAFVETKIGNIPEPDRSRIVHIFNQLPADMLSDYHKNEARLVSIALDALRSNTVPTTTVSDQQVDDSDYSVDYYEDTASSFEFDSTNVEAAAQLFYVMVWGDEMGIFESIDRIAAQTSADLQIQIRQRDVADDLALYVFDEQFRDLKTGRLCRRIPRAEREMFYRQLFGIGDAQVTDGMRVNREFQRLWLVLMTEVTKYIGRVEESPNPENAVSKQKVIQAMLDLGYNLSSACVGMVKVAAPVMYREMEFVIRRLLSSDDILNQLGTGTGKSFFNVIQRIRGTGDLSPLRNKGKFGHAILSSIAKNPTDDDATFGTFIQTVEAYILAESQLDGGMPADGPSQQGTPASGGYPQIPGIPNIPGIPSTPGMPLVPGAGASGKPADGWNF